RTPLFFHCPGDLLTLHSFPTRRSSDLDAQAAFADFDHLWKNLSPREQARLLKLLISSVDYDGQAGTISVTFRPTSIRSLINRRLDRKSTRLNSSHVKISYAVFCLKKKK